MNPPAHLSDFTTGVRCYRTLMGVRYRTIWQRYRGRRSGSRLLLATKAIVIFFPLFLIGMVLFVAFQQVFSAVESKALAETVLASLIALIVVASFVCSSTTALQSLYLSNDLPFLMTLPLPLGAIYGGKILDAMTGTLPTSFVMVLLLSAYGIAQGGGILYFAVAIVCLALTMLVSTSTSVLFVAAVTRYIPPKRARLVLVLGTLFLLIGVWSLWVALLPTVHETNGEPTFETGSAGDLIAITPAGWAAHALSSAASGNISGLAVTGSAFVMVVALCSLFAFHTFAQGFQIGYTKIRGVQAARPKRPLAAASARAIAWLPQDLGALVLKEWLVMFRDLRRLSGAIWPVGMVAVYTIALSRQNYHSSSGELRFWLSNAPLALLPWGASLGISIYAFGTEGRNLELLRSAPVRPFGIFFAKAFASFVPVLMATEAATLIVTTIHKATFEQGLGMVGIVAWAAIGYVLIDSSASALSPNFDADHVQRSTSFAGRANGIIIGATFGIFSAVAIGRTILFFVEPPESLRSALDWQTAGVSPIGWPLVVVTSSIAVGVVAATVRSASASVGRLIRDGA
jgi:ABC-2 type transport system permease protein